MPFTVSHAAAALPLRRALPMLPLDALIAGTMSPDFEYVLRLAVRGRFWHTPVGLLMACVPASLVVVWVWRALVRPALLPLLPAGMRPAGAPVSSFPAGLGTAAAAALLGAVTHVLWDGFTHRTGWAVMRLPRLAQPVLPPGLDLPLYNLLQHVSTLVGGIVLLAWLAGWVRRHPAEARRFAPGQRSALLRTGGVLLVSAVAAALANGSRAAGAGSEWMLGYAAVGGMAGLGVAATAYGVAVRLRS